MGQRIFSPWLTSDSPGFGEYPELLCLAPEFELCCRLLSRSQQTNLVLMEWADAPPTWKQLKYLKQLGYTPAHRLTKTEACELILKLGGRIEEAAPESHGPVSNPQTEAFQLRRAVEEAKCFQATEKGRHELTDAITRRQQFWGDTCREIGQMHSHARPVLELYRKHGCLFHTPTSRQVQDILDALDTARPGWEKDHPELFFETLGLNFPDLVRRH